jgi:hypothetical protein
MLCLVVMGLLASAMALDANDAVTVTATVNPKQGYSIWFYPSSSSVSVKLPSSSLPTQTVDIASSAPVAGPATSITDAITTGNSITFNASAVDGNGHNITSTNGGYSWSIAATSGGGAATLTSGGGSASQATYQFTTGTYVVSVSSPGNSAYAASNTATATVTVASALPQTISVTIGFNNIHTITQQFATSAYANWTTQTSNPTLVGYPWIMLKVPGSDDDAFIWLESPNWSNWKQPGTDGDGPTVATVTVSGAQTQCAYTITPIPTQYSGTCALPATTSGQNNCVLTISPNGGPCYYLLQVFAQSGTGADGNNYSQSNIANYYIYVNNDWWQPG